MSTKDNPPDTEADGKWMTHTELAEARGISKASAARLIRRHKWRRQADNQQRVQVLVPFDAISEADIREDIRQDIRKDGRPDKADISRIVTAFDSAISALRERAETADRQAEAERARVDATERRADVAEARTTAAFALLREASESLTAERASKLAAEAEAARLRQVAEQALADARTAAEDAAEARWGKAEAEQVIEAAEAEIAQLRQAVERARAEAETLRATEAARAAAQAQEQASRPNMVASRIDELQLRRLQEAEQARKALGRLARLRAAWRGE